MRSHEAKVRIYCKLVGETDTLAGLPDFATRLRADGDRVQLRQLAKEVDVWIRETLGVHAQLEISAQMRLQGVRSEDLPALPIGRRVRGIVQRGVIRSQVEADVIQAVLINSDVTALFQDIQGELGLLNDAWTLRV